MKKVLNILRYGANCEGIAEDEGKVVFVENALAGEICECEILKSKNKFLFATNIKTIKKVADRIIPKCQYFFECGGCDIQHIEYKKGTQIKTEIVENNLKKIGGIQTKVSECVESPEKFYYRNKLVFSISQNGKLGFFKKNTHNVIEIDDCVITKKEINFLIPQINNLLQNYKQFVYNWKTQKGLIKNIEIRFCDNEYSCIVVQTQKNDVFAKQLQKIFETTNKKFSLYISVNKNNNSLIYGDLHFVAGEKNPVHRPFGFVQINTNVKNIIYEQIANISNANVVVDAYAGACELSAIIAQKAKKVFAIEISEQSCQDAKNMIVKQNIGNLIVNNGDCAVILPQICERENIDCVVLDPPRKGCDEKVIKTIVMQKPKQIIYLSCNSSTLSRDIKSILDSELYKIVFVKPYDMFAWSNEVETLVYLERK